MQPTVFCDITFNGFAGLGEKDPPAFLPPVRSASPPVRWSHQVLQFHRSWPSSGLSLRFRAVLCASSGVKAADPKSKVENFDFVLVRVPTGPGENVKRKGG